MPEGIKSNNVRYYSFDKKEFKLKRKENGNDLFVDFVSGQFMGVTHQKGEYQGKPANRWVVTLNDGDYILKVQFSEKAFYGGAILNSLMNVRPYQHIEIQAYARNYKDKSYMAASVCDPSLPMGDNWIKFKYDFQEDVPKPQQVLGQNGQPIQNPDTGRDMYDHSKVIEFWKQKIEIKAQEFIDSKESPQANVPEESSSFPGEVAYAPPEKQKEMAPSEPENNWLQDGDDDDLPF